VIDENPGDAAARVVAETGCQQGVVFGTLNQGAAPVDQLNELLVKRQ
jgi:hypothetical protein